MYTRICNNKGCKPNNNKMKITIDHYNVKRTIETEHDDLTFNEFMDLFLALTKSIYNEELINDYFNE